MKLLHYARLQGLAKGSRCKLDLNPSLKLLSKNSTETPTRGPLNTTVISNIAHVGFRINSGKGNKVSGNNQFYMNLAAFTGAGSTMGRRTELCEPMPPKPA